MTDKTDITFSVAALEQMDDETLDSIIGQVLESENGAKSMQSLMRSMIRSSLKSTVKSMIKSPQKFSVTPAPEGE